MERDPFEVLGVQHGAEKAVVTAAYKALAKQYHPDLNPGDETAAERMKEINDAYTAIRSGDYHEESYYHPESGTPSGGAPNPAEAPNGPNQQYAGGTTGETYTAPADNGYTGYEYQGGPGGETVEEFLKKRRKGDRTRRQWYYNGKPVTFRKAMALSFWNKWGKSLAFILLAVIALLVVYKLLTGQNFAKDARDSQQQLTRSLTQAEQKISLPDSPSTLMIQSQTYQVIWPES